MSISRRNFFRQITMGAAVTATPWRLEKLFPVPPEDQSSPRQPGESIRLDMNINPYGPSPKVLEVIRANLDFINRYPDTVYRSIVDRIADFHRIKSDNVVLVCVSLEVLRMAGGAFLTGGK